MQFFGRMGEQFFSPKTKPGFIPSLVWMMLLSPFSKLLVHNQWNGRSRCGVQLWIFAATLWPCRRQGVVWCFDGAGCSACISGAWSCIVSYPGGVGKRTTIFSQTRCKTRIRFKPIVTVCRPGIRDGKMEASCSTLRTSLWRWWVVAESALHGWLGVICKNWRLSCKYGRKLRWKIGRRRFTHVHFQDPNFDNKYF